MEKSDNLIGMEESLLKKMISQLIRIRKNQNLKEISQNKIFESVKNKLKHIGQQDTLQQVEIPTLRE